MRPTHGPLGVGYEGPDGVVERPFKHRESLTRPPPSRQGTEVSTVRWGADVGVGAFGPSRAAITDEQDPAGHGHHRSRQDQEPECQQERGLSIHARRLPKPEDGRPRSVAGRNVRLAFEPCDRVGDGELGRPSAPEHHRERQRDQP